MLFRKLSLVVLSTLIVPSAFSMEVSSSDLEEKEPSSISVKVQALEEDKFTRTWAKVQALLEARIEENKGILLRIEENFEQESKVLFPQFISSKKDNLGFNFPNAINESKKMVNDDIVFFDYLKNAQVSKFDSSLDEFLWLIHSKWVGMQSNIELAYKKGKISRKNAICSYSKDDISFLRYAIKKLSPYQTGWFRYLEVFVQVGRGMDYIFDEIKKLLSQNVLFFLKDEVPKLLLSEEAVHYITHKLNMQCLTIMEKFLSLNIEELSKADKEEALKNLAKTCAKINILFRQFTQPDVIKWLQEKYPRKKEEIVSNDTALKTKKSKKPRKKRRNRTNAHPQSEKEEILPSFPSNKPNVSSLTVEKEEGIASDNNKPSEKKPVSPPRLTALDLKKQRRAEKAEQQARAKEWAQRVYAEHLATANFTTNRDLIAEFEWMNDIINPDITLHYRSIIGKLNTLTTVKNGEGSRRHFIIYDTPIRRPIACYFHEPHPDEAVRIEKWRLSISEALKKAGYFQLKEQ